MLNFKEALSALNEGKTIRPIHITGIEICRWKNTYLFKHRDGKVELLDPRVVDQNDTFVIVNKDSGLRIIEAYEMNNLALFRRF